MKVSEDVKLSFSKAKIRFIEGRGVPGNNVFLSTILLSLQFSWDDSMPTACTNGLNLRINPKFWAEYDVDYHIFILAHEVWHIAFQHTLDIPDSKKENFKVWNEACDHYINIMLHKQGYKMMDWVCRNMKYEDQSIWSSEKIYQDLMKNPQNRNKKFTPDFEAAGDNPQGTSDGKGMSQEEVKAKMENLVVKAAVASKMQGESFGELPGQVQNILNNLTSPKLPWNTLLRKYMNTFDKNDYSYSRRNRRYSNVILPSLHSVAVGHIAVAVDTSCSVSQKQFDAFRTEIVSIHKKLKPSLMTVVDFDTTIHNIHTLSSHDKAENISFSGRGGTNMHPVFEYYTKKGNAPEVLIVFSDMECNEITKNPGFPVIWVRLEGRGFQPSFGKVINFEE